MNRKVIQRWDKWGNTLWGILEADRFYPFSLLKEEVDKTLESFSDKPDNALREEGFTSSAVLLLDEDPKIILKTKDEEMQVKVKAVEEQVQSKAVQNAVYLQAIQQLMTSGFNAVELFGNANFPVAASTAPVTQSKKEVPSPVVAATSEGRLFREDDE